MHAYLIIAHKNPEQIKKLLSQIDDERNDVFLLFDRKSDVESLTKYDYDLKHSKLYFAEPVKINWGGYSQIQAELNLLTLATKTNEYDYLHLISGQDLLIKSQDYIHDYFKKHQGEEFLNVAPEGEATKKLIDKNTRYYYRYQEHIRKHTKNPFRIMLKYFQKISLGLQKLFKVNRHKKDHITFYKGANWFSITNDFAKYVVSKTDYIHKLFHHSMCCDEIFLHTLFFNSEFSTKLANERLREIDWARGNGESPYTYRINDLEMLKESNKLFARKFDADVDSKIIDEILKLTK